MKSNQYNIPEDFSIPYYEEEQKRTFLKKLKKLKNSICQIIAYGCPSSKLRVILHRMRGVKVGKNVHIGMFVFIDNLYPDYIFIENNVGVNAGSTILAHFNPSVCFSKIFEAKVSPVLIKSHSVVSVNSTILPGVEVGNYSIVGAGSVVTKSIEDYTIVQGNPAKKVAKIPKSIIVNAK